MEQLIQIAKEFLGLLAKIIFIIFAFTLALGKIHGQNTDTILLGKAYDFRFQNGSGKPKDFIIPTGNLCGTSSTYYLDYANEDVPDSYAITTSEGVYHTGPVGACEVFVAVPCYQGFALTDAFYTMYDLPIPVDFGLIGYGYATGTGRVVLTTEDPFFVLSVIPNDNETVFNVKVRLMYQDSLEREVYRDTLLAGMGEASHTDTLKGPCTDTLRTWLAMEPPIEPPIEPVPSDGIFIPDAFSPNGDGVNDVFTYYGEVQQVFGFVIFDRWGNKLYEAKSALMAGWDGTRSGQPLDPGVFLYDMILVGNSGKLQRFRGGVTLVR